MFQSFPADLTNTILGMPGLSFCTQSNQTTIKKKILFVAAPALVYVLWSAHVSSQSSRLPYILRIVSQLAFETGFLFLQWFLYGKLFEEHFHCNAGNATWRPCIGTIECYLSRPQEKNIFLWYMYGSDIISIALTILELVQGKRV